MLQKPIKDLGNHTNRFICFFCWILQCLIGLSIEGNHDKLYILEVTTISDSPLVTTELMSAIFLLVHVLGVLPVGVSSTSFGGIFYSLIDLSVRKSLTTIYVTAYISYGFFLGLCKICHRASAGIWKKKSTWMILRILSIQSIRLVY